MTEKTFTLDLHGQCYDMKSLKDAAEAVEQYIERRISVYENTDNTYPSPRFKIKVTLEELKDA